MQKKSSDAEKSDGPAVKQLTKSPGRVTHLLELVARAGSQGLTLTELSKVMASPRTSLIGLVDSLVHEDYIVRQGRGFRLGWAAFRMATAITSSFQLRDLTRSELERLAEETEETILLCTFANQKRDIVYLDKCESKQSLRFSVEIGTQRPVYCTAGGRAMLAFQPQEWQDEYLRTTKLERFTAKTIVSVRQMRELLAHVRERGYSTTEEEISAGICGFASPILDQFQRPVAALVIAAPSARAVEKAETLCEALRDSALRISRVFGLESA